MPQIPVQTSQTVFADRPLQYQNIQASPDSFGAPQAQGLQRLGNTLDQVGDRASNLALYEQGIKNEADVNAGNNQLLSTANDLLHGNADKGITGLRQLQGKQAVDASQDYQDRLQESFDDIRSGLNPAAQRAFDLQGQRILRGTTDSMGSYKSQQEQVYNHTEARAAVQLNQNAALANADDPDAWNHYVAEAQQASIHGSQVAGLDGDAAELMRKTDLSNIFVGRTDQLAVRDPIAAAKFYHDNIGMVMPEKRYELEKMLKTTTDAQYSRSDGVDAYRKAIAQPSPTTSSATVLPQDFGANNVKPYADKQIDDLVSKVKAPSKYDDLFNKIGAQFGINPTELKLRAASESGFNPNAVSNQGAQGLMQIMPATAKALGIDPNDPEQAIRGAATLMQKSGAGIGADMSKVDRAYYGGSTDAQGKNTDQYVDNLRAVRSRLFGDQALAPRTAAQLEGTENEVINQARVAAEQRRPGDAVYADQVVAEAHTAWARDVQAIKSKDYANVSGVLDAVIKGGAQSVGELPTPIQQLFSQLTPQNIEAVRSQFTYNQKKANGEFAASDPKMVNDLRSRLYLPDGDPMKITNPGQLVPYIAHGVNYTDHQHLLTEMKEANNPETNPFMKQVNKVKETATKMMTTSMNALSIQHPELAQEAAYRFGADLDKRVRAMQAANKDPQSLFTPGSPDYVLAPNRVAAFMPSESDVAAQKANAVKNPFSTSSTPQAATNNFPTATNPKTGKKLVFKDGSWQPM